MEPESSRITNLNAYERETIVNANDEDETVRIWTAQRRHITRLRRHPGATEVASGSHGKTPWAEFTIPAKLWNPVTGIKRRSAGLSEEQRAAAVQRLAQARSSR